MKRNERYDAVIVGARAAGAATAMLLARAGLKVIAVDRSRYGSDTLSTHALMRPAVVQLHRWGLLERVRASGTPPVSQVTFRYPDETIPIEISPSGAIDALYAPRRTVLDALLVDAAQEAGADVRFGVIVDDLQKDESGRVRGILARDEQGERITLSSELVIGADGIRSIVAQAVEAQVLRRACNSGAVVYGYYEGVEASGYEWAYAPGLSAGFIPTNDGLVCAFVGGSEADFRRRVFPNLKDGFDDVLREVSSELHERIGAGSEASRHRGFAGVRGYARQSWGAGWALVGDAGYFRDPITTHGISDAFRDAELLARAVSGISSLEAYQELRNGVTGELFDVTDRIAGYDWSMEEIRQHLLDVSRAMKPELKLIAELDESSSFGRRIAVA
ncbi:MAG: FAD-dependent monooxygenase [Thermoanaerobaculia bacterium]|nr:FAD-dependent monooxygenase [Thermoanaerobaculia bacterium]